MMDGLCCVMEDDGWMVMMDGDDWRLRVRMDGGDG